LFAIVVHAAWLTLNDRWLISKEGAPPHAVSMSLLLVAGSMGLRFDPGNLVFDWSGLAVLYYAFFVFGLRAVQIRRWLACAGLVTFIGVGLALASNYGEMTFRIVGFEIPRDFWLTENMNLDWQLNRPGEFLTLLVFFLMGRWLGAILRGEEPSADTLSAGAKLVMGTVILYLGAPMWRGLVVAVAGGEAYDKALYFLSPAGSYLVLPLLALSLAITRHRGMLISAVLVGAYYLLSAFAPGSSIYIDFGDFAVAIAFAALGVRITKHLNAADLARATSWLTTGSPRRESSIEPNEWKRQHDEVSNTVRRVMLSLLAYALFCGITLASAEDVSIFGGSEVTLPFANTKIGYATFLTAGPLILVGLTVYLHLFLQSAIDLGRPQGANPLPYIFNMDYPVAAALSSFMHYWLPVLLLFLFAWKAVNLCAGYWLGLASTGMAVVMLYLHMARMSAVRGENPWRFSWVMLFSFALLFAMQMANGSALLKRPLSLDGNQTLGEKLNGVCVDSFAGASLRGTNFIGATLRSVDFRGASMQEARLAGVDLSNADLSGADLSEADLGEAHLNGVNLINANLGGAILTGADLGGANLPDVDPADIRGVKGVDCENLERTKNWKYAYRNTELGCGENIPQPKEGR
jgi:hypothetical protein